MTNESKFLLAKCLIETNHKMEVDHKHGYKTTLKDAMTYIFLNNAFPTSTVDLFINLLDDAVKEKTLKYCNELLAPRRINFPRN